MPIQTVPTAMIAQDAGLVAAHVAPAALSRSNMNADAAIPAGVILPFAGGIAAPSGWLLCDGSNVLRATYATLFAALCPTLGTFTVTIASPAVFTLTNHGLRLGDRVRFSTTGALPTGLSLTTDYFVSNVVNANSFRVSTTAGGADVNTSGSQSGTHTAQRFPYGPGDGSTTFGLPDLRGRVPAGLDAMGGTAASRLTSAGSGVYAEALGQAGGAETHTLTAAQLPAHAHPINGGNTYSLLRSTGGSAGYGAGSGLAESVTNTSNNTGGGSAHLNTQPTLLVAYIVKT